jgi:hypothetical protein
MSSTNWKEYVTEVIKDFRQRFENLDTEVRKIIKEELYEDTLLEPCQIEVLASSGEICCFVAHDKNVDDMEVIIREVPVGTPFAESEFLTKYRYVPLGQSPREYFLLPNKWVVFNTKNLLHPVRGRPKPSLFVHRLLRRLTERANEKVRSERVISLEKSASGLEASISKLPESEARSTLGKLAKEIDKALEDIKRVDKELLGVRKIMGASKEYQDWRVLISDVDRLKGEHVSKGEFESEIKRVDDRIKEGLNAIGSRVSALSDIREAYDKVLAQQNEFMKQQADVMKQQVSFVTWIKYATILLPIAVISVPIIEIVRYLLGMH